MKKRTIVVCPQCFQSSHELSENYDPEKPVNGTMIMLSEPYRSYGWETHAEDDTGVGEGDILCGFCGEQIVKNGVIIMENEYDTPTTSVNKKHRRRR